MVLKLSFPVPVNHQLKAWNLDGKVGWGSGGEIDIRDVLLCARRLRGAIRASLWILVNILLPKTMCHSSENKSRCEATLRRMQARLKPELPKHWDGPLTQEQVSEGEWDDMQKPLSGQIVSGRLACARLYLVWVLLSVTDVC